VRIEKFTFRQVASECDVHVATVWRWVLHGVRGRKLASIHVGGRRYITRSDLDTFLREGSGTSARSLQRRAAAAGKELKAIFGDSHS